MARISQILSYYFDLECDIKFDGHKDPSSHLERKDSDVRWMIFSTKPRSWPETAHLPRPCVCECINIKYSSCRNRSPLSLVSHARACSLLAAAPGWGGPRSTLLYVKPSVPPFRSRCPVYLINKKKEIILY